MKLMKLKAIMVLVNEIIASLQVGDYDITDEGVMVIHVTECDYEHYIDKYAIESDLENHTIKIDLLKLAGIKKEPETMLERMRRAKAVLTDIWDMARYVIYEEITAYKSEDLIGDEQLARLVELGVEVYIDQDTATPTGVGSAITDILYQCDENGRDYNEITYEEIDDKWLYSDRT